jgi:hypothetical protein
MLPGHIIEELLERERRRKEDAPEPEQPRIEIDAPLPDRPRSAPPADDGDDRGITIIPLF